MSVRIGCCGFATAQERYYKLFPLVEIQQTFYEPPRTATALRWRASAPTEFAFTIKAWQLITHAAVSPTYRRLKTKLGGTEKPLCGGFQPTWLVWDAWLKTREIALALQAKAIVFQCPASFAPTPENRRNLRQFFERVRTEEKQAESDDPLLAWEPRGGWTDADIMPLCEELRLVHCVDPFQRSPVTRRIFYFRLHGIGGYSYRYADADLSRLQAMTERFEEGYCLFNNVFMLDDARRFQERLGK